MAYIPKQSIPIDDESVIVSTSNRDRDAFGRHRISLPFTIFEVKHILGSGLSDPLLTSSASGNGFKTFEPLLASTCLTTQGVAGDYSAEQSKRYMTYRPGRSQAITITAAIVSGSIPGSVQRMGYYENNNGMFFENDGGQKSIVLRSNISGIVVEERISQANWNLDTVDGSGNSGFNLNMERANIYTMDFQWLGVGRVRYGISQSGIPIYVHEILNENEKLDPYMSSPNLPVRWENFNKTTQSHGSILKAICAVVISEGGDAPTFISKIADNKTTSVSVGTSPTVVLAVRPKVDFNRLSLQPLKLETAITSNATVLVEVYVGGIVNGGSWVNNDEGGVTEKNVTGTSYSSFGATKIDSFYMVQTARTSDVIIDNKVFSGSNFDGSYRQPVVVVATKIGAGNVNTFSSLLFNEVN